MESPAAAPDRLREHSIGLPQVLFQSITHMAPGAAIAFSILVSVQFAGPALPLVVLAALVACLLVASSIGQLAKQIPSAGGLYAYVARALGPAPGFMVGWAFLFVNAERIFVEEDIVGIAGPDVPPAPAGAR